MFLSNRLFVSLFATAAYLSKTSMAVPMPQANPSASASVGAPNTRNAPSWGLDRIDARDFALDGKYTQIGSAGLSNIDVYILDSGINENHVEFQGVPITKYNVIKNNEDVSDSTGRKLLFLRRVFFILS
jgi:hypothetical protein